MPGANEEPSPVSRATGRWGRANRWEEFMTLRDDGAAAGRTAYVRADQPWGDAALARLYDTFPFDADLPLYLELAAEGGRVLEVACGTGRVLVPLARAGHR